MRKKLLFTPPQTRRRRRLMAAFASLAGGEVTIYCLLFTLFIGCGYSSRSLIAQRFKTIYVEPFVNKIDITHQTDVASKYRISKPTIETDITKSVINKFVSDGNLRPVAMEAADLILKGEVVEFRRDPLRYTDSDEVEEYRLNLVVNLTLWDRKEDKLIWEEKNFTGETTYFTVGAQAKSEIAAIADALNDLSRRIVERAVEEW